RDDRLQRPGGSSMQNVSRLAIACLIAITLAACGGNDGPNPPAANKVPNAAFTVTPADGEVPLDVAVDASATKDPDGSIAAYARAWGDGQKTTAPQADPACQAAGEYARTRTVTDHEGAACQRQAIITVTTPTSDDPPADDPPGDDAPSGDEPPGDD